MGTSQLGPQQLKYMTVLKDSSDCLALGSLINLLETTAAEDEEEEEESFFDDSETDDLILFLACWCNDLSV